MPSARPYCHLVHRPQNQARRVGGHALGARYTFHDPRQRGISCSSTAFRRSRVRLHHWRLHHWRLLQWSLHHPLGEYRNRFSLFLDVFEIVKHFRCIIADGQHGARDGDFHWIQSRRDQSLTNIVVHGHINFESWCRMGDAAHWCRAFVHKSRRCMGSVLRRRHYYWYFFTMGGTGKSTIRASTLSGKSSTTSTVSTTIGGARRSPTCSSLRSSTVCSWIRSGICISGTSCTLSYPFQSRKKSQDAPCRFRAQKPPYRL